MSSILLIITENIFVILGFAIYAVLVYYILSRVMRGVEGKGRMNGQPAAPGTKKKDKTGADGLRRDFSRNLGTSNVKAGRDFRGAADSF